MMASPSSPEENEKPQVEPLQLPTLADVQGREIYDNCAVRSVMAGVMGGGMGILMGVLLGALDNPVMQEEMTTKQIIMYQAKQMGRKSYGSMKTFALLGLIFSASECVIEKARAKHDIINQTAAGCVTGAALSARGGPKAACMGCAGFAAFSAAIEKFLDRHD